jgi:hypothetical protein
VHTGISEQVNPVYVSSVHLFFLLPGGNMKRTKVQFNVWVNPHTRDALAAVARLKGIKQGELIEQLARPTIERLADALEVKQ